MSITIDEIQAFFPELQEIARTLQQLTLGKH
jgi:hypothetical protein